MPGDKPELSAEELRAQEATELPEREAMTVLSGPVADPVNAATAVNFMSEGAEQTVSRTQEVTIVQQGR